VIFGYPRTEDDYAVCPPAHSCQSRMSVAIIAGPMNRPMRPQTSTPPRMAQQHPEERQFGRSADQHRADEMVGGKGDDHAGDEYDDRPPDRASASWLNLVERFFGEITRKRIRRGVFKSGLDLDVAIYRHMADHNDRPKPSV
jgi:hypothetical protein